MFKHHKAIFPHSDCNYCGPSLEDATAQRAQRSGCGADTGVVPTTGSRSVGPAETHVRTNTRSRSIQHTSRTDLGRLHCVVGGGGTDMQISLQFRSTGSADESRMRSIADEAVMSKLFHPHYYSANHAAARSEEILVKRFHRYELIIAKSGPRAFVK